MGTSNWQNIPYCVEAIMRIEPKRVLDIGVGFGRWGMIVREFCELWYGRVHRSEWQIEIEGVEGYAPAIEQHHHSFYNKIHVGDFREIAPTLKGRWDLVIFGDVLEHFEKAEARGLLNRALEQSEYVLVNIPLGTDWPQEDIYENLYERHLSVWSADEFKAFALRRMQLFEDYLYRPFGSFILSLDDAKDLAAQLFSASTAIEYEAGHGAGSRLTLDEAQRQIYRLQHEIRQLEEIKRSRSYRVTQSVLNSRYGKTLQQAARALIPEPSAGLRENVRHHLRAISGLRRQPPNGAAPLAPASQHQAPNSDVPASPAPPALDTLRVVATGEKNLASQGCEVWLLAVDAASSEAYDLRAAHLDGGWELRAHPATPDGWSLVGSGAGMADLVIPADSRLVFLTHPWSGQVVIGWHEQRLTVDLYSAEAGTLIVAAQAGNPARLVHWKAGALSTPALLHTLLPGADLSNGRQGTASIGRAVAQAPAQLAEAQQAWLEQVGAAQPAAIAIMHPEWRGVRSSTTELFRQYYFQDDTLDAARGTQLARMLLETGCRRFVLAGFPLSYVHLVQALRQIAPDARVYSYWLGSFLQSSEEQAWKGFTTIERLCRAGAIYKWGFAKQGMAEIMASLGLRTGFLMSLVRRVPEAPSTPLDGGPHIGLWAIESIWRKSPYAMLAACRMIDGAIVHGTGKERRALEFAELMRLSGDLRAAPIPQAEMPAALAGMHLNLYVTLSECAPMLPLESLAAGAPCLLGPTSHYFEDHDYLHSRLVVPYPDRGLVIASYIEQALAERKQIITAYRDYAPGYNTRALQSVRDFLEVDADTPV
jgi:hypothetical protein